MKGEEEEEKNGERGEAIRCRGKREDSEEMKDWGRLERGRRMSRKRKRGRRRNRRTRSY